MSDIVQFGDEDLSALPGAVDPATAYSRRAIYPGATAFAYINENRAAADPGPLAGLRPDEPLCDRRPACNRMAYAVGSGHTYNVLPRHPRPASECPATRTQAGEELLGDCLEGARGDPLEAEQVEPAAEGDRPPPGPRRRAVPAAVRSTRSEASRTSASSSPWRSRTRRGNRWPTASISASATS